MNFLTPLAFAGAVLSIPIILLYMLRLRRREVTISSTFLWRQMLQDREANTPWQRLRRNLLLILQLIILALLVLALARPFITVPAVSAGQVTVLLDASASMNATDINGRSRFEQAKDKTLDIINTLSSGDRLTVIRVAEVPEVLVSRTQDRQEARSAVNDAQPSLTESDWNAAMNLAAAGGAGAEDHKVVIIGDGGLPEGYKIPRITFNDVEYIRVGQLGENVALTALATRTRPGETPELYAQITNYGQQDARVVFTLLADGERIDSATQDVPAGRSQAFFRPMPEAFNELQATLTQSVNSPAPDYLAADNVAYATGNDARTRRVLLVTNGNRFLEQVLRSIPGLDLVRTDGATGLPDGFDLVIFDTVVPNEMPEGDLFFINPARSVPGIFSLGMEVSWLPGAGQSETTPITVPPISVASNDPRTQFLDWGPIFVGKFHQIDDTSWADTLIDSDDGSLLLAGEVAGRQVAILPFDPVRSSNLALDIAWPILIANLAEWFAPNVAITVADNLSVGESLLIRPPLEADGVTVTLPNGDTEQLPIEREGVVFAGTTQPGIYTIQILQGDTELSSQKIAVNLFSKLESQITPKNALEQDDGGEIVSGEEAEELGQREFWPLVALLAAGVLLLEWLVYHRRMRIPTVFSPMRGRASAT